LCAIGYCDSGFSTLQVLQILTTAPRTDGCDNFVKQFNALIAAHVPPFVAALRAAPGPVFFAGGDVTAAWPGCGAHTQPDRSTSTACSSAAGRVRRAQGLSAAGKGKAA
jgi:hypothetical protein